MVCAPGSGSRGPGLNADGQGHLCCVLGQYTLLSEKCWKSFYYFFLMNELSNVNVGRCLKL